MGRQFFVCILLWIYGWEAYCGSALEESKKGARESHPSPQTGFLPSAGNEAGPHKGTKELVRAPGLDEHVVDSPPLSLAPSPPPLPAPAPTLPVECPHPHPCPHLSFTTPLSGLTPSSVDHPPPEQLISTHAPIIDPQLLSETVLVPPPGLPWPLLALGMSASGNNGEVREDRKTCVGCWQLWDLRHGIWEQCVPTWCTHHAMSPWPEWQCSKYGQILTP